MGGTVAGGFAGGVAFTVDTRANLLRRQLVDQPTRLPFGAVDLGCPSCIDRIDFVVSGSARELLEPHLVNRGDQGIGELAVQRVGGVALDLGLSAALLGH